jgi:hypothetical protein
MDMKGLRAGRLLVLDFDRVIGGKAYWTCQCDCGHIASVRGTRLRAGVTNSCGCGHGVPAGGRHLTPHRPDRHAGFSRVFRGYKSGARRRGIAFELTEDEFVGLVAGDCFYCGHPPVATIRRTFTSNGIDRVDNDKPYTNKNCVPACARCNYMKGRMSVADFISHVRAILENARRRQFAAGDALRTA